mmetsp:Transcript_55864/g.120816  ORF Transcript_55864/g.120816 Transcript_55864/m.120816 type:complete len:200 (-) Transcript_55864:66-665(-)
MQWIAGEAMVPLGSEGLLQQLRPWHLGVILGILLESVLLCVRFWMGDTHGSMLMFVIVMVGLLALLLDNNYDVSYFKYFGIMSFISGSLDMSIVIESVVKSVRAHDSWTQPLSPATVLVVVHLACSVVQLASAVFCYLVCRDAEGGEEPDSDGGIFATTEEARIYGTALMQTQNRRSPAPDAAGSVDSKAFVGPAYKLP